MNRPLSIIERGPRRMLAGAFAATLLLAGCRPDGGLETRTFELTHLEPNEAMGLLDPYVYGDRAGAPGAIGVGSHAITVREFPENLDRIEAVLAEFDRPPPALLLDFKLVHADGYTGQDPEIAEVEAELRRLFRFQGYRLIGGTVVRGTENTYLQQNLVTQEGMPFELEVAVGGVRGEPGDRTIELRVQLGPQFEGTVLEAELRVKENQTVVLGTTSVPRVGEGALILLVETEIEDPA